MTIRTRVILWVAMALWPLSATAHDMHVFVTEDDGVYSGRAYYEDDEPATGMAVTVVDDRGDELATLETDREGRFEFSEHVHGDVTFIVRGDDGHEERFTVHAQEHEEVHGGEAHGHDRDDAGAATSQLRALQEQIDALQNRLWMRDVIGSIGYILGIFGLIALWRSRKGVDGAD